MSMSSRQGAEFGSAPHRNAFEATASGADFSNQSGSGSTRTVNGELIQATSPSNATLTFRRPMNLAGLMTTL